MSNEKDSLDIILDRLNELDTRLAKIEKYLERQKGFLGGLLFIGSCITWAATYIKDWFK